MPFYKARCESCDNIIGEIELLESETDSQEILCITDQSRIGNITGHHFESREKDPDHLGHPIYTGDPNGRKFEFVCHGSNVLFTPPGAIRNYYIETLQGEGD